MVAWILVLGSYLLLWRDHTWSLLKVKAGLVVARSNLAFITERFESVIAEERSNLLVIDDFFIERSNLVSVTAKSDFVTNILDVAKERSNLLVIDTSDLLDVL